MANVWGVAYDRVESPAVPAIQIGREEIACDEVVCWHLGSKRGGSLDRHLIELGAENTLVRRVYAEVLKATDRRAQEATVAVAWIENARGTLVDRPAHQGLDQLRGGVVGA